MLLSFVLIWLVSLLVAYMYVYYLKRSMDSCLE